MARPRFPALTKKPRPRTAAAYLVALLAAAVLLPLLPGCGGTDTTAPTPPASSVTFPDTADKLMANFKAAYRARDYAVFCDLLTPDFATVLLPGTMSRFPDVGETLDVPEEQRIHGRMFGGHDVVDPNGLHIAAVRDIRFDVFEPIGGWTPAVPNSVFPGAESRLYDVVIVLDRGQSESELSVHGQIQFFVTHRDSTAGGVTRPYYRMRGQVDLTSESKAVESSAWGSVKAIFR